MKVEAVDELVRIKKLVQDLKENAGIVDVLDLLNNEIRKELKLAADKSPRYWG
jgi:hypothetical protein